MLANDPQDLIPSSHYDMGLQRIVVAANHLAKYWTCFVAYIITLIPCRRVSKWN